MQIYLPIAELPVNVLLILFMGLAVGFISGMFGIGGGFLMTPLLIFVGIAPAVAVASVASHVAASSFSGAISVLAPARARSNTRPDADRRRPNRHHGRRHAVHAVAPARPARSHHRGVLFAAARHRRDDDDHRERERDHARARRTPGRNPPSRQPPVDPRPAAEDAVQGLQDLRLGDPDLDHRLRHRLHRRRDGHRRRVHAGAGADLPDPRADRRGDRHLDGAHSGHDGLRDRHPRRHQPSGRCPARADADDRRRGRGAVRRARRAAVQRRAVAAASSACSFSPSACASPTTWWCRRRNCSRSAPARSSSHERAAAHRVRLRRHGCGRIPCVRRTAGLGALDLARADRVELHRHRHRAVRLGRARRADGRAARRLRHRRDGDRPARDHRDIPQAARRRHLGQRGLAHLHQGAELSDRAGEPHDQRYRGRQHAAPHPDRACAHAAAAGDCRRHRGFRSATTRSARPSCASCSISSFIPSSRTA